MPTLDVEELFMRKAQYEAFKLSILSSESSWKAYGHSSLATTISTRLPRTQSLNLATTFPAGLR